MKIPNSVQTEIDVSYLYETLAKNESNEEISKIFTEMSEIEKGHAQAFLKNAKRKKLPLPSFRAKFMTHLAKYIGYEFILDILMNTEKSVSYGILKHRASAKERGSISDTSHVMILKNLLNRHPEISGEDIVRFEKKHKSIGGNALRAGVLGGNDGLVSNFSLVMGVAGATSGQNEIILAGVAGLLAGALSMALGEWISVKSSQELYENQIELEKEEIEHNPEGEKRELILIYRAKGIPLEQAKKLAEDAMKDPEQAHKILVKEELGINAEDLQGSAMEAAITSFILFAIGAIIPITPFFFLSGFQAIIVSALCSSIALFVIGALITLFTGKGIVFSGLRQVVFGAGAAAITYFIGSLIGTTII